MLVWSGRVTSWSSVWSSSSCGDVLNRWTGQPHKRLTMRMLCRATAWNEKAGKGKEARSSRARKVEIFRDGLALDSPPPRREWDTPSLLLRRVSPKHSPPLAALVKPADSVEIADAPEKLTHSQTGKSHKHDEPALRRPVPSPPSVLPSPLLPRLSHPFFKINNNLPSCRASATTRRCSLCAALLSRCQIAPISTRNTNYS